MSDALTSCVAHVLCSRCLCWRDAGAPCRGCKIASNALASAALRLDQHASMFVSGTTMEQCFHEAAARVRATWGGPQPEPAQIEFTEQWIREHADAYLGTVAVSANDLRAVMARLAAAEARPDPLPAPTPRCACSS